MTCTRIQSTMTCDSLGKMGDLLTGNNLKSEWVVYAWFIGIPELDEKIWIISLAATDSCTSNSYQAYVWQELPNSTTHNQLVHFRKDPFIAGA